MKYYTSTTEFNCGIDLHARQMYVCVMDRQGKKLVHTNVKDNDFAFFLKLVERSIRPSGKSAKTGAPNSSAMGRIGQPSFSLNG